ncbi:MAG: PAS domain S-box protein [candidate division Zixibacteria bacterium]|nr:PAS domain S-box protein [candidate division Zixibacteria bacterium]
MSIFKKLLKPSLLLRLTNVIFLQIIFVFAALVIILFSPAEEINFAGQKAMVLQSLNRTTNMIAAVVALQPYSIKDQPVSEKIREMTDDILLAEKWIVHADLFILDDNGNYRKVHSYHSKLDLQEENILLPPEPFKFTNQDGIIGPLYTESEYLGYFYPFELRKNMLATIGVAVNHELLISNRGSVKYALLLTFLAATLISLLTVYMLIKWFKEPMSKIIDRMDKTAEGGIYYQIEAEGNQETRQLAKAFNEMSAQLYDSNREAVHYHDRLSEVNRSNLTSKRFLSALINNSPDSLIVASADGQIMIFNNQAIKSFGYENDQEIIGHDIQELFTQSVDELTGSSPESSSAKGIEVLCWKKDKSLFPAFAKIAPIKVADSSESANLFIIRDITESKTFQQMMIRLNKNYTRGEMAGDIAHDINNYLAVLMGNVELIPMFLKKNNMEKVEQKLAQMKKTLDKINNYTSGLLDSEHDDVKFARIHVNQIIENVLAFLKPQKRCYGINVITELSTELPVIDADPAKLQQLLVNIFSNSCDALHDCKTEKTIRIRTLSSFANGQHMIRIEINDNGAGVPEEKREKLFTERFTTKRKGHGIGLITCRRIVDAHGGSVGYDFTNGTTFYIELPQSQGKSTESRKTAEVSLSPQVTRS